MVVVVVIEISLITFEHSAETIGNVSESHRGANAFPMVGDPTGGSVMSISQQKALGLEAANMQGWSGLSEHPAPLLGLLISLLLFGWFFLLTPNGTEKLVCLCQLAALSLL